MATENGAVLGVCDGQSIFKESLGEAAALAMSYLARLDRGPVGATADAALVTPAQVLLETKGSTVPVLTEYQTRPQVRPKGE